MKKLFDHVFNAKNTNLDYTDTLQSKDNNIVSATEEITLEDGSTIDNILLTAHKGCVLVQVSNTEYEFYFQDQIYELQNYKSLFMILSKLTENDTLTIYINSPGGSVSVGFAIIAAMKNAKCKIITVNLHLAASMASGIWAMGDELRLEPGAITMFHDISSTVSGELNRMSPTIEHIKNVCLLMFSEIKKRNILTEEEITNITTKGTEYYIPYSEMSRRLGGE
jgi:ATP-dependent protease ClpP protease subunit